MAAKAKTNAARNRAPKPDTGGSQTDPAVIAFLGGLDHPLKPVIEAVRQSILEAGPEIREGIKWKSPSFRTTDYFATVNLRKDRVWLILHTGAKVKESATKGLRIADPAVLLEWLAKDRCVVTFADVKEVRAKRAALQAIIRQWIQHV